MVDLLLDDIQVFFGFLLLAGFKRAWMFLYLKGGVVA